LGADDVVWRLAAAPTPAGYRLGPRAGTAGLMGDHDMDVLAGKTAVVTGAGSGMGRAFANRFATAGMQVVLADVEEPALDEAVREVAATGVDAIGVRTDVSKLDQVEALLATALDRFGRVNVVCNNAGVAGPPGATWDLPIEDWHWVLGVNLWGVIHGCKVFLPHLVAHGDGHVVNTASMAGLTSGPMTGPYSVSKHGVVTLSEGLSGELAMIGSTVGVSVLCPGFVSTRILEAARNRPENLMPRGVERDTSPQDDPRWSAAADMLRSGKPPAEVADLVHDAIVANRFYIYTDDVWLPAVKRRHDAIESGTNPSLASLEEGLDQSK
jgi:NAD(P)-dependent dehydrogenase (short-subunit alcohol dehydrogenase family)